MFVLTLDGVLRQESTGAPIPQGIVLYEALTSMSQVGVLCTPERDKDDWWLKSHSMLRHVQLVPENHGMAPDVVGWRRDQITYLRAQGYSIDLFVDSDPSVIADAHGRAITTALFLSPKFSNPSHRPDWESVARPWDELVAQVQYQESQRVKANSRTLESEIEE